MKFMKKSSYYISNINRALRDIKSDVLVNFICSDSLGIMVVMYKVTSSSNLQVIENNIKNVNCTDITDVDTPCLLQSKSYLKIIDIPVKIVDGGLHFFIFSLYFIFLFLEQLGLGFICLAVTSVTS